jgi:2-phosphosulfolactate phosphatase
MIYDQSAYHIRCEWGEKGVSLLAPISDAIVIVDVLSFSTAVDIATGQGAIIYPYHWKDETVEDFAKSVGAQLTDKKNEHSYRLSPTSLLGLPPRTRLVLPSPNGSHLSLLTGSTPTTAGCLRNCRAVAEWLMKMGKHIAVIPAGERWENGQLRPCLEDMAGAGAIISYLRGALSPEAEMALAVFENIRAKLMQSILGCVSGKEKAARGEQRDVALATELNASRCVPLLKDGAYYREA